MANALEDEERTGDQQSPGTYSLLRVYMALHGIFDVVHDVIIENSGVPTWWPSFCGGVNVLYQARSAVAMNSGPLPYEDRLVFITAGNEWGEANHLEPDLKYGRQSLIQRSSELNF